MRKRLFFCLRVSVFCLAALALCFSCDLENRADPETAGAARTGALGEYTSPLANLELGFRPTGIQACCYYIGNPATLMIDGGSGAYWDWGWSGTASSNNSDFFTPANSIINTNCQAGHISGHSNALSVPAHFFTVDLGEKKENIWRVAFYGRETSGTDNRIPAQYEVWVSDNPIGADPAADGAVKAAAGTWPASVPAGVWRYADFTADSLSNGLASGRYIQFRSLADPNGGIFEIAGREFNVDILGDYDGAVDTAMLRRLYLKGLELMSPMNIGSSLYRKMHSLMYGLADGDGNITVKGAKQILEEAESPPPEMTIVEKMAFQREIDAVTEELRGIAASLDSYN
jgi:hypothetical protein